MARIGARMRAIRDYAAANPGASVTSVLYATHRSSNLRWIDHPTARKAIYRAEAAGLIVIDRRRRNRYRVYDAELYALKARCWCDWPDPTYSDRTHEAHIVARDYPDHEVSLEWNVPEPREIPEPQADGRWHPNHP